MGPESKKFRRGPRELAGAVDLISHYKLLPLHKFFCKQSLPLSTADTHYLHSVVGDTEIRDEYLNDVHKHRKSKHKSSKIDEIGVIKVAG